VLLVRVSSDRRPARLMPMRCSLALRSWLLALAPVAFAGAATPVPPGSHYVALGSSFAAGPGVTTVDPGTPGRCTRSLDNYAQQLARRRGYVLTDASCSGATTSHVLGQWDELPPQVDALRAETRLVTVTIGGNDLGYMGVLGSGSCRALKLDTTGSRTPCRTASVPAEADYVALAARMSMIATEVKRRSPLAQLVFVDYVTVLPSTGSCAIAPLADVDASLARMIDSRLRAITARTAGDHGALLLEASRLTREHHACAADPWVHGFPAPDPAAVPVPAYHPKLAGMTAIAEALDALLPRPDALAHAITAEGRFLFAD